MNKLRDTILGITIVIVVFVTWIIFGVTWRTFLLVFFVPFIVPVTYLLLMFLMGKEIILPTITLKEEKIVVSRTNQEKLIIFVKTFITCFLFCILTLSILWIGIFTLIAGDFFAIFANFWVMLFTRGDGLTYILSSCFFAFAMSLNRLKSYLGTFIYFMLLSLKIYLWSIAAEVLDSLPQSLGMAWNIILIGFPVMYLLFNKVRYFWMSPEEIQKERELMYYSKITEYNSLSLSEKKYLKRRGIYSAEDYARR